MKRLTSQCFVALFAIVSLLTLEGCKKDMDNPEPPAPDLNQLYANAIADGMIAENSERIDTLWPISNTNSRLEWKTIKGRQYVLMATFMRFPSSYPEGDSITTTWGEAWLFIPQQMKMRIGGSFKPGSDTLMRICQLLGLPPVNSRTNTHISEMWVPMDSLQRPAGNPDIQTTSANEILISGATATYSNWFNNYIIYAYYHTLTGATDFHYPWTRLGYTYDWVPNGREVGLSEYVLRSQTGCWVNKTRTASNYFRD
ncbi:hypothetical protein HHL16_24190 [Pseudoflavitalea sp. G-6-1-2]|uniref:hypothetical protein n=1 Tax=Pseudoflavitalea sp. G-6-1-2 TaxID=2728841 RepID=UPI00146D7DA5|nr:hypothetical protein [Pseudoflavitalea sp. G-6-1-2]NML24003.1 hypothetical protein [Pseudoflavitalea sp. G-6-1-2]